MTPDWVNDLCLPVWAVDTSMTILLLVMPVSLGYSILARMRPKFTTGRVLGIDYHHIDMIIAYLVGCPFSERIEPGLFYCIDDNYDAFHLHGSTAQSYHLQTRYNKVPSTNVVGITCGKSTWQWHDAPTGLHSQHSKHCLFSLCVETYPDYCASRDPIGSLLWHYSSDREPQLVKRWILQSYSPIWRILDLRNH